MSSLLGLIAGLSLFLVAGAGVTLLANRGGRSLGLLEIGALSFFLGTGLISLLLWIFGAFLSGAALKYSVTAVAVALGILGVVSARREHWRLRFSSPRNAVEWMIAGAVTVEILLAFHAAFSSALGWDGLLNWEVKARYAFFNHGVLPATFWSDETRAFMHQSYPLWVPFSELWLYLWMGEAHQFWIKTLFPLFYLAGVILLATFASRLTGRRWLGLLAAFFLYFIPCLTTAPGGVQSGYADVPLAMLYLATVGYLLLQKGAFAAGEWRLFALCLVLLPWAKHEGAILWLSAAACGAFMVWRGKYPWRALLWLLPGAALISAWKIFCTTMGKGPGTEFVPLTVANLLQNSPRILPIVDHVVDAMLLINYWNLFWPILALSLAALALRMRNRNFLVLFVAIVAPISAYAATYVLSNWPTWGEHMDASFSRLLLHVVPVGWLAIALAARPPENANLARSKTAR